MKFVVKIAFSIAVCGISGVFAQNADTSPQPSGKAGLTVSSNLQDGTISRERREQALAKLLEAQRYMWSMGRVRTMTGSASSGRLARAALQKAIELDPTMSEAYTALAELTLSAPPNDIEEAIMLANIAVKLNRDNYGAHRILARVYTIKSKLNDGNLDPASTQKAIDEWKEVARLDPRNAEAWAFLAEFYGRANKTDERIKALQKWLSSAAPIETRFYRTIMGAQEDLSPESASLKLGTTLLKTGKNDDAIEILSRTVAEDPDNTLAIDTLKQAIEANGNKANSKTVELLQQAAFANPQNTTLTSLLAEMQSKLGRYDDATKTLLGAIKSLTDTDRAAAANLQISLGDVYIESKRSDEAIKAYEDALKLYGVEQSVLSDEQRDFAVRVFEKIIGIYKNTGRIAEAKATIERARLLLGKNDLFADKNLISLLREDGDREGALALVRAVRRNYSNDYGLIRTEASLLTDLGRVDEGAALIRGLIGKTNAPSPYYDDFSNYLFISSLFTQAKRGKEAIQSAQQAYSIADGKERKQLAILELANAQYKSGDYKSAESALRNILKQTPDNPIALNNLGYFLLQRGANVNEALGMIQKAVEIDPANPAYLHSLGLAFLKSGDIAKAEKNLTDAYKLNPSSISILELLGDLYQKQGKSEMAKEAWQRALKLSYNGQDADRLKLKMATR